jgi:hypothetical protein
MPETSKPRILFICPDLDSPTGGIKQIYRNVDILNSAGFNAVVLHSSPGFRCTWFRNDTKVGWNRDFAQRSALLSVREFLLGPKLNLLHVAAQFAKFIFRKRFRTSVIRGCTKFLIRVTHPTKMVKITGTDILVFPEVYVGLINQFGHPNRKVIFHQNAHYSFSHCPISLSNPDPPYKRPDVIAVIVISEHSREYLKFAFPELRSFRIHYGVDSKTFRFESAKKKQIAVMPRKNFIHVRELVNLLNARQSFSDFEIKIIQDLTENETAQILMDSMFFLSFSINEGCPMPPLEAMFCGCVVIGYTGFGGLEYFQPDFSFPVSQDNLLEFAQTTELAIETFRRYPDSIVKKATAASDFVRKHYSMENEKNDALSAWEQIFESLS